MLILLSWFNENNTGILMSIIMGFDSVPSMAELVMIFVHLFKACFRSIFSVFQP